MSAALHSDDPAKSLTEAIVRSAKTARGREFPEHFRITIREFLAQKFCDAIKTNPGATDLLVKLFDECTRR
jgi:hypothetical protein